MVFSVPGQFVVYVLTKQLISAVKTKDALFQPIVHELKKISQRGEKIHLVDLECYLWGELLANMIQGS